MVLSTNVSHVIDGATEIYIAHSTASTAILKCLRFMREKPGFISFIEYNTKNCIVYIIVKTKKLIVLRI